MTIISVWIYRPRSGDRVRALVGSPQVGWVEHPNGCRHVVGDLVHLTYEAARPGRWWREAARMAAAEIVSALRGGAAWDEQGRIHLLVVREQADEADRVMQTVRPYADAAEDRRNAGALFRAGVAEMALVEGHLEILPSAGCSPAREVTPSDAPAAPWAGKWYGGVQDALEPAKAAVEAA